MSHEAFDYTRYLIAKKSIDERSIDIRAWEACKAYAQSKKADCLRILEVGGGTAASLRRLLTEVEGPSLSYTIVDVEASHQVYVDQHLADWLGALGFRAQKISGETSTFTRGRQIVTFQFVVQDVHAFLKDEEQHEVYDLLIAQAFLDLFDLEYFLPGLLRALKPGGGFYFPINFDGVSAFLPVFDPGLDRRVERCYHDSMDARRAHNRLSPRSEAGRHLIPLLKGLGMILVVVGSSDWIIYSDAENEYIDDEAFFLEQILSFFEQEISKSDEIAPAEAAAWLAKRREQVVSGELIFLAHQLDVFGEKPHL